MSRSDSAAKLAQAVQKAPAGNPATAGQDFAAGLDFATQRVRSRRRWMQYFVVTCVLACVFVSFNPEGPAWQTVAAVILMIVPVVLFPLLLPPIVEGQYRNPHNTSLGWAHCVISAVILVVATSLNDNALFASFYVIAQISMLLDYVSGMILVAATYLSIYLVAVFTDGFDASSTHSLSITLLLAMLFSLAFARPIDHMAETNARNQALLVALHREQATSAALARAEGSAIERERLAREMHDTVTQALASITAISSTLVDDVSSSDPMVRKQAELIAQIARGGLQDSREMIRALAPRDLTGSSLAAAVSRTVDAFVDESGIKANFVAEDVPALPPAGQVVVLRVCQEALANVRKHSGANYVEVSLCGMPGFVRLKVSDDGGGFEPDVQQLQMPDESGGFGLHDMRSRAAEIGGKCEVTSGAGKGCVVSLKIPVATTSGDEEAGA